MYRHSSQQGDYLCSVGDPYCTHRIYIFYIMLIYALKILVISKY